MSRHLHPVPILVDDARPERCGRRCRWYDLFSGDCALFDQRAWRDGQRGRFRCAKCLRVVPVTQGQRGAP